MIKHIIFDFYGTLVDTDPDLLSTKRSKLLQYGRDKWMVQNKPEEHYFSKYAKKHDLNHEKLTESFQKMEESTQFFPGIPELIKELTAKYKVHIFSNTGLSIHKFLDQHPEVTDLLSSINLSYELGVAKPSARAYEQVLLRIHAKPEECVMIGDSRYMDILPAKEVGMRTIHFNGRMQTSEELAVMLRKIGALQ